MFPKNFIQLLLITCTIFTLSLNFLKCSQETEKDEKHVLLLIFPGGKSHHFMFKELLNYVTEQQTKNPEGRRKFIFHLICHNYDVDIWKDTPFHIYGYGNLETYHEKFESAIRKSQEDPVNGYNGFNLAMQHNIREFFDSGILEKLKKIKFDIIMPDMINFIAVFLKQELRIPYSIYTTPTCFFSIFYSSMEFNTSYMPVVGSKYNERMSFAQRMFNNLSEFGIILFNQKLSFEQTHIFNEYGYSIDNNIVIKESLFLSQCTDGVHYAASYPPNFRAMGPVLPKPAKEIKDKKINDFLNKFKHNFYVSQGTIVKIIKMDTMIEIFNRLKDVGFVISFKSELIQNIKFPENVLSLNWAPQNDLLGDQRVTGFITHGGINSILESVYHAKPMVVIGINIDQLNNASIVGYRKFGIDFTEENKVTPENLINAINEIISNNVYKENVEKASKLVQNHNAHETFLYWLDYVIDYGYDHLFVKAYKEYNYIQLYNLDVFFIFGAIIFLILNKLLNILLRK